MVFGRWPGLLQKLFDRRNSLGCGLVDGGRYYGYIFLGKPVFIGVGRVWFVIAEAPGEPEKWLSVGVKISFIFLRPVAARSPTYFHAKWLYFSRYVDIQANAFG